MILEVLNDKTARIRFNLQFNIDTLYVCIHRVRTGNHCLGGKVVKWPIAETDVL